MEGPGGKQALIAGDHVMTLGGEEAFEIHAPGSLRELIAALERGEKPQPIEIQPEYEEREARLAKLDEQGVAGTFLFPAIGMGAEHYLKDDPDLLYASLHAYNRWVDDAWNFSFRDRIYSPPFISLKDCERAVAELDWALERGAKLIGLKPGPAYGRSPADPHFDSFWSRMNDAGAIAAYHLCEAGYNELLATSWGEPPNPPARLQSAWQWTSTYCDRPIMDTLAALVFGNLFGRFPKLKVISVENGAEWLPYLVRRMDKMQKMAGGRWIGGRLADRASEVFREHIKVTLYPEDDIEGIVGAVGAEGLLFGSDWPHPEGLVEPRDFVKLLDGLTDDQRDAILYQNAASLVA
ncbi:MAG: amidohydrolase family protein [Proteobacteria bacterium]|nr:amidohydrolase family protein [Pseudomonadota bacterium]